MSKIFPTDPSINALTYTSSDDQVVVYDTSEGGEAKTMSASLLAMPQESESSGKNIATGTDYNSIATNLHSASIYGGGTIGSPNTIGSATHEGSHDDPDYPGGTALPNHATIIGSYDQLNNQQATVLLSPHSFAPATGGGAGHNAAIGGSWSKIDGTYNFIGGGGGSFALQNETTPEALKCAILGGEAHTVSANYSAIIGGRDAEIPDGANGSVVVGGVAGGTVVSGAGSATIGGITSPHAITNLSPGSALIGGRGNTADKKAYQVVIGQDAVGHIRAGFTQGTDNIRADGDAQRVTWVGRGSGTGTVSAYPSSAGDCEFGGYGESGGFWAGGVRLIIRNTVTGDKSYHTGDVMIEWTTGGASSVVYQTWTDGVNEPSPGNLTPSMGTGSNGRIFARGVGLLGDVHDVVAYYDGVMTHF